MSEAQQLQENLRAWLEGQLPGAEDLQLEDFRAPEAGASNETQLFTATWKEGGTDRKQMYVLRMAPQGQSIFPSYELKDQYRAMALLQDTDIKVPVLLDYEEDETLLGSPFYVMEGAPGRVLAEAPPYYVEGWLCEASEEERRTLWTKAIQTVASVNRLDWKALGFDYLLPEGKTSLQAQLDEYTDFLRWAEKKGEKPYPTLWALHDWLVANQPEDEPVALCWGDAKVANFLFEDNEVTAVLDWELVLLGNPVHDLAWWLTLDNTMSEGLAAYMGEPVPQLPGVLSREEIIELWERESGFSARDVDYYEVLGAFKFGIMMCSMGVNYMDKGLLPREMQVDLNNSATPVINRLIREHSIPVPS